MRILPIIDFIAQTCDRYQRVSTPVSLEPIDELSDIPAAFVYWINETTTTRDVTKTSQKRVLTFGVMTVAQMPAANAEPLEDVREQLIDALLGWAPSAEYSPITHSNAEIMDIRGDIIWVRDYFTTALHIRTQH